MSSSLSLEVDRDAAVIFDRAAIAVGMSDPVAALEVCRQLAAIEPHYRLALRVGADAPQAAKEALRGQPASTSRAVRLASKHAGTCRGCGTRYAEGDPIWWTRGTPGALCEGCGAR